MLCPLLHSEKDLLLSILICSKHYLDFRPPPSPPMLFPVILLFHSCHSKGFIVVRPHTHVLVDMSITHGHVLVIRDIKQSYHSPSPPAYHSFTPTRLIGEDNVCIESMSCTLTRRSLERATASLNTLAERVAKVKTHNADRLKEEYRRLVEGLRQAQLSKETDQVLASPSEL